MKIRRTVAIACMSGLFLAATAGTAFGLACGNASKPVGPGEKAVVSAESGEPISVSKSWQNQLAHGKTVDQLHGGFIGIDVNGDGVADADTYANPQGEVPENAQVNGAPCHGVVEIEQALACSGG